MHPASRHNASSPRGGLCNGHPGPKEAAGRAGGTMTGVFSAANEQAVAMFLDKKIGYFDIFKVRRELFVI